MNLSSPLDDAGARALDLVRHQFNRDHAALRRELANPTPPAHVDTEWLANAWADALQQVGELHSVEEPALHLRDDLCLVVEVPLHFARGDLSEQVTFDAEGHVAAVSIRPARK